MQEEFQFVHEDAPAYLCRGVEPYTRTQFLDKVLALLGWSFLLSDTDGTARAVIRIDGNSRQSFREYRLGR
jgi:hypothetical protein